MTKDEWIRFATRTLDAVSHHDEKPRPTATRGSDLYCGTALYR